MNPADRPQKPRRRRGMSLVVVVVVMAIAAGLLSVLAAQNVDMYRRLQLDRARCTVRSMSASMTGYTQRHRDDLARLALDEPQSLDLTALAGDGMELSAEIRLTDRDEGYALKLTARVQRGRIIAEEIRDLEIKLSP
jgi:type II secretory pathway pseudopilin PulG